MESIAHHVRNNLSYLKTSRSQADLLGKWEVGTFRFGPHPIFRDTLFQKSVTGFPISISHHHRLERLPSRSSTPASRHRIGSKKVPPRWLPWRRGSHGPTSQLVSLPHPAHNLNSPSFLRASAIKLRIFTVQLKTHSALDSQILFTR